ncbi:MAG: SEL1-like repeat protein [Sulfitobacter sp.]
MAVAQNDEASLSDQCAALAGSKWEPSNPESVPFSVIDPSIALPVCQAALEQDATPVAKFRVARILMVANRDDEAFKLITDLQDSDLLLARDALAFMLFTGRGTPSNVDKAVEISRELVSEGFGPGYSRLGAAYLNGLGVSRDPVAAAKLFKQGADVGEEYSIYVLGWMLETGTATKADPVAAAAYYKHAADMKYPAAKKALADLYSKGVGVEKSETTAFRLMKEAAELGDASAQERLGYYFQTGFGVKKDVAKAIDWYDRALKKGNGFAAFNLGVLHEFGQGVPKSPETAVGFFEQAIELGNDAALGRLGLMAYQGRGMDVDRDRAGALLSKANLTGNGQAQSALADMLYFGTGLPQDQDKALTVLRASATEGYAPAAHLVAQILLEKNGDLAEVETMLKQAAQSDNLPQASLDYAEFLTAKLPKGSKRKVSDADRRSAFPHYKKASDAELPKAMLGLGWAYYGGYGTKKDVAQAESLAKRAKANGVEDADNLLKLINFSRQLDAEIERLDAELAANLVEICETEIKLCGRGCDELSDGRQIYNTRDGKHWFHRNGRLVTGDDVPDYSCEVK